MDIKYGSYIPYQENTGYNYSVVEQELTEINANLAVIASYIKKFVDNWGKY